MIGNMNAFKHVLGKGEFAPSNKDLAKSLVKSKPAKGIGGGILLLGALAAASKKALKKKNGEKTASENHFWDGFNKEAGAADYAHAAIDVIRAHPLRSAGAATAGTLAGLGAYKAYRAGERTGSREGHRRALKSMHTLTKTED